MSVKKKIEIPGVGKKILVTLTPLEVGDVVVLKSGGPEMTVEKITMSGKKIYCAWFDGGKLSKADFDYSMLSKAKSWVRG